MTNKEKYQVFCESTYVPIYSKPWWLDTVCGPENWDVWLYESGGDVLAAMPCYFEIRGAYRYITKAPLTQTNGLLFKEIPGRKLVTESEFQEKVINAACAYIQGLDVDVFEQQFSPSFKNWQPFFWHHYTNILRYTYIISDTSDMEKVDANIAAKYRNEIRKGQRLTQGSTDISAEEFYLEHQKVFRRQGLSHPFSLEFWLRVQQACSERDVGQMFCSRDPEGHIHSLLFLVWDERFVYHLFGGYMPEYSSSQAYPALTYHGINFAHEKGLAYDFEGSMVRQIAVSFRQFGGIPTPYYRIRKVFNPEILRKEAEDYIQRLQAEKASFINAQTPPSHRYSENP